MPNLAAVLKEEIRRLARKEAKAQVTVLRTASAQYRRAIAALRRANKDLTGKVSRLDAALAKREVMGAVAKDANAVRFAPAWVRGHRQKLGLSQEAYAALVGVSPMTIYNWEKGVSRPAAKQLAAWGAVKKLGRREASARLGAAKSRAASGTQRRPRRKK